MPRSRGGYCAARYALLSGVGLEQSGLRQPAWVARARFGVLVERSGKSGFRYRRSRRYRRSTGRSHRLRRNSQRDRRECRSLRGTELERRLARSDGRLARGDGRLFRNRRLFRDGRCDDRRHYQRKRRFTGDRRFLGGHRRGRRAGARAFQLLRHESRRPSPPFRKSERIRRRPASW